MKSWIIRPQIAYKYSQRRLEQYPDMFKDTSNPTEEELQNFFQENMDMVGSGDVWEEVVNAGITVEVIENDDKFNEEDDEDYEDWDDED